MEQFTYEAFRKLVKDDLRESLAVWKLSEEDLEAYLAQNEDEIRGAYKHFQNPYEGDTREESVRFKSGVSSIAYSLQMAF